MLLANNTGGGFYAQGSQSFVASAAAGAAIGSAIKAASNFDACMMANGWEIADEGRVSAPASYASATFNNTPPAANFSAVPPAPTPIYTGDVKNGIKEGHGTATYLDGSKYVGDFKNDVRSGNGVWTNARGDRYEGGWANDMRNGFGTYFEAGVAVSRGIWRDGEFVKRQTVESISTAPVSANAAPSDTGQVNTAPLRSTPATVASSKTEARKAAQRKPISATAAALSAASPPKVTPPNPNSTTSATLSAASSSVSAATCTHEQLVQARIAKMNGYTAGPKCD